MHRIALLIISLLVASPAAAQSPDAREQAKSHYKQGKAYQDAGAYDLAVAEYKAAFELSQAPELAFNIGQAYRLAGKPTEAIAAYEAFLQLRTAGSLSDEARAHIATLRAAAQTVEPPPPAPAIVPAASPITTTPVELEVKATPAPAPATRGIHFAAVANADVAEKGLGVSVGPRLGLTRRLDLVIELNVTKFFDEEYGPPCLSMGVGARLRVTTLPVFVGAAVGYSRGHFNELSGERDGEGILVGAELGYTLGPNERWELLVHSDVSAVANGGYGRLFSFGFGVRI
jgi:hypothetical protein